jgi:RND family efflux transporter MFP subunit
LEAGVTPLKLIVGLVLLMAGLGLWACERNSPAATGMPPASPPPNVTVAKAIVRDVTLWDEYTGRLDAVETVDVKAQVSGFVDSVAFDEGSIVKKGDLLLTIDPSIYQSQLENAKGMLQQARAKLNVSEATLQLAQNNFKRAEEAARKGSIAPEELDTARYTVAQDQSQIGQDQASIATAEAAVRTAEQWVQWCKVTAPISGRISNKRITVGNLLNGGSGQNTTVITTITSIDPIYCYFDVDETHVLKYQNRPRELAGTAPASATLPFYVGLLNERGFPRAGTINFFDNAINPATSTLRERGILQNPNGEMLPGMFARVRIAGEILPHAQLVLDEAVGTDQNLRYVYVLRDNHTVERRIVTVGPLVGELRVITGNLKPDELVIVNGLSSVAMVRPGSTVSATIIDMPEHHLSPLADAGAPAAPASAPGAATRAGASGAAQ